MPDSTIKRPHFFSGKLLNCGRSQPNEQQYEIGKSKRHNRYLHGFGIVTGLEVAAKSGRIVISPGLALDCEGNEILVETTQVIEPPKPCEWRTAFLNVRFVELETDPLPGSGKEQHAAIIEGFEFAFAEENCNRGHRHLRARWLGCGQPHALTIAKLRNSAGGWRVDRGYRAPAIK